MKIVIATPLYPPQLGGPAQYAAHLAEAFGAAGHAVAVHSFGGYLRYPPGIRHGLYFLKTIRAARGADIIFALDSASVGFPAALAAAVTGTPLVIRVEGDFLWESFVERTRRDVTLAEFYRAMPQLSPKERLIRRITKFVLSRASRLAFSSEWRREMMLRAYGIPREKTVIIRNVFPVRNAEPTVRNPEKVILWAGRMLYLKNLYRLIEAFGRIKDSEYELCLVGDGPEKDRLQRFLDEKKIKRVRVRPPLGHAELEEAIAAAAAVALPSLSEVGPTFIAEALSKGKPFLMTKESGSREMLGDLGVFVDPLNPADIERGLRAIMADGAAPQSQRSIPARDWDAVAVEWTALLAAAGKRSGMRILVVGNDPHIFDRNHPTHARIREYARLFDELHIISPAPRGAASGPYGEDLFLWPIAQFLPKFLWPLGAAARGVGIARKYRSTLVDAQDAGEAGLAALIISRMLKIPLRLQVHTDVMSPQYRRAGAKERMRFTLARLLLPRAACIRAASERIKRSLVASNVAGGGSQIVVLPIFTDIKKFLEEPRDENIDERFRGYGFKMIAVGRFVEKEKNFLMAIDVLNMLKNSIVKPLLVIAGDGPDRAAYAAAIKNKGLQNNVILEPWRADLSRFYKSFDACLVTSNYEGWGRVALEAMASGLPVVTTDVGLAGEVIRAGENGIVVSVGDGRAMADAVLRLAKNPSERARLAAAARKTAENLTPKTGEEYLQLYRKSYAACTEHESTNGDTNATNGRRR